MMAAETLKPGMPLSQLLAGWSTVPISADVHVTGVALDSRQVKPGDVFLACRGSRIDGSAFIADALHNGAIAVVLDGQVPETLVRQNIAAVAIDNLPQRVGDIAARFYGDPSADMKVVGITGTNGKTSISSYCAQSLAAMEIASGLFGTLGYGVYGELQPGTTTTPDPITLQRKLAEMRAAGVEHVLMEVSSHALDQGRVNGTAFDIAVLTNLSRDHLDYHADMDAYASAKRRLFDWPGLRHGLINRDDAFGRELLAAGDDRLLGFGMQSPDADLYAVINERGRSHMQLELRTPWGQGTAMVGLTGDFNAANVLTTLGVLCLLDIPWETALESLAAVQPAPGRMQLLGGETQPLVVIDYAHTPAALAQTLASLRSDCRGRLWCVFGCGGERDTGKRPLMAAVAEQHADHIIITSDNPRGEEPEHIIQDICAGLTRPDVVQVEPDRGRAIETAIHQADNNDTVLIAGKGHETYQDIAGVRYPFSDSHAAQACLQARQ